MQGIDPAFVPSLQAGMGGDQFARPVKNPQGRGSDMDIHGPGPGVVRNRIPVGIDTDHALPVDLALHPHGLVVDAGRQWSQMRPFPAQVIGNDPSGGSMTAPVCFLPAPVFEPAIEIVHVGKLPGHEE